MSIDPPLRARAGEIFAASLLAALLLATMPTPASATTCSPGTCLEFPGDAGVINVKSYGAVGDGVHDDTTALRAAIRASDNNFGTAWWRNRIVYLPEGTYLVSDTLYKRSAAGSYMSSMVLIGASRSATTLRLRNNAPGFANASAPKALIYTSSTLLSGTPTAGGKDYAGKGEGDDAYANYVENMTIDVGQGNPGAVGIDFLANNMGALRNLWIVGAAGSGAVGISMDRKWPGPALVSNVSVSGFDVGISVSNTEYGVTFDKNTLSGQRSVALRNNGNALSINDLAIDGDATGITNRDPQGLVTAVNVRFSGHATTATAIDNGGSMTLRQITSTKAARFFGVARPAGWAFEGVYQANTRVHSATPPWALAIRSAPAPVFSDPPETWANVRSYGAVPDGVTDSTSAVRQALASGATTIYFPYGTYVINDTVEIPPNVRRIEGMMSTLSVARYNSVPFWLGGGIFKVSAGGTQPLLIERLNFDMINRGGKLAIEYLGAAPLVVRDVVTAGIALVDRAASGGPLFVENVCCGPVKVAGPSGAWLRQFNSEGSGTRITNSGSPLWILGMKIEQNATVLSNLPGSVTEALGGLVYLVVPPVTPVPAFLNNSGRLFAAYAEASYRAGATYQAHLLDQTPGAQRTIYGNSFAPRGMGRMVPMLSAAPFD